MKFFPLRTVLFLILSSITGFAQATTICVIGSCPQDPADPGGSLPTITEIYSLGNVILDIDNQGLIILDIEQYNTHPDLTIDASTPVYFGLDALPASIMLPEYLELATVGLSDGSITGPLGIDYLLLRQFDASDSLMLSATLGVLVMDTSELFAVVPVPAAAWLFISGMLSLGIIIRRRISIDISTI